MIEHVRLMLAICCSMATWYTMLDYCMRIGRVSSAWSHRYGVLSLLCNISNLSSYRSKKSHEERVMECVVQTVLVWLVYLSHARQHVLNACTTVDFKFKWFSITCNRYNIIVHIVQQEWSRPKAPPSFSTSKLGGALGMSRNTCDSSKGCMHGKQHNIVKTHA